MRFTNGASQPVERAWNKDEMSMVGHQTIRPDGCPKPRAPLPKNFQVRLIVILAKERPLAAIAPLSDVMWYAWNNDTGDAGHSRPPIPRIMDIYYSYDSEAKKFPREMDMVSPYWVGE
jgi:hypothetical protein